MSNKELSDYLLLMLIEPQIIENLLRIAFIKL
jgi:hypothetical protein